MSTAFCSGLLLWREEKHTIILKTSNESTFCINKLKFLVVAGIEIVSQRGSFIGWIWNVIYSGGRNVICLKPERIFSHSSVLVFIWNLMERMMDRGLIGTPERESVISATRILFCEATSNLKSQSPRACHLRIFWDSASPRIAARTRNGILYLGAIKQNSSLIAGR